MGDGRVLDFYDELTFSMLTTHGMAQCNCFLDGIQGLAQCLDGYISSSYLRLVGVGRSGILEDDGHALPQEEDHLR